MITKLLDFSDIDYKKLKKCYKEGQLVAIPTETVYGLSADATNTYAVKKIYEAKGRPSDNPLIVHFYDIKQIRNIVDVENENVQKLIDNFWPGSMSLILNIKNKSIISNKVTAGLNSLAVRMPSNKFAREILKQTEVLLAAPSANTSGKPSPTKFSHVYNDLKDKIDIIIKADDSDIGLESTVIDCTKYPFEIARPGDITLKDLKKILGEEGIIYRKNRVIKNPIAPGMKYRHYSPNAELIILDKTLDETLFFLKNKKSDTVFISYKKYENKLKNYDFKIKFLAENEDNIEECNRNFYNILRECDLENIKEIYIMKIKENDVNEALLNRLEKASSKK